MTLLAAYSFDTDGSDATGNGHGFTLGAGYTLQTGHTNTGLRHESTSANGAGPTIFGQTAQRSLEVWVKRSNNAVDGWIVEMKDSVGDTGLWGFLFTGGNVQARCKNTGSTVFTVQTAQPTVNVWYHLAMTYDGSKLHLYINGTEVGTGTTVTGTLHTGATIFPFTDTVGTETIIDDVRVYDNALSGAQITTDMNTPVSAGSTNTGTIAATFSAITAAASGTAKAAGIVGGTFSAITAAASATAKLTGAIAGGISSLAASVTGTATASGSISASLGSPAADVSAIGSADGVLSGVFSSVTASFSAGPAPVSGILDGSIAPVNATMSGLLSANGAIIGTFAAVVFTGEGGVPVVDRDILFTIQPGTRSGYSITVGPVRQTVDEGATQRTQIGAGNMDKQWRKGSEQYVDFIVTMLDPEGELTLPEVEAIDFQILITSGAATPELTDPGWASPSVAKEVTADGAHFKVSIMHMYQALETGLHTVWVKFGPTPERPLYQAASFVVL